MTTIVSGRRIRIGKPDRCFPWRKPVPASWFPTGGLSRFLSQKDFGTHVIADQPLAELVPYIDWSPFFHTWELKGRYPSNF